MTYTDKNIVNTYSELLEGLSPDTKKELIESLSRSIKEHKKGRDKRFYKTFGAFESTKTAEEIVRDIKASRAFRKKEIKL